MKKLKIFILSGLLFASLLFYSFTVLPPGGDCTLYIINTSDAYMGVDSYDGGTFLAPGQDITFIDCLCETDGTYVPFVQADGPSNKSIKFTASRPGTTNKVTKTVNGGSYEEYQVP